MKKIRTLMKNLTVFDYLSIIATSLVILMIGLFFLRRKEWVNIEVKILPGQIFWEGAKSPYWLVDQIEKGDKELDSFGKVVAEVVDVTVYERWGDRRDARIELNLKAVKNKRKDEWIWKGKELDVGAPIKLRLSNNLIEGVVSEVEGLVDSREWREEIVEAKMIFLLNRSKGEVFPETLGVMPWMAEAVKIGDQMIDTRGRVVAEILDKKIDLADKIVTTATGKVYLTKDPVKKDVVLKIKLKVFNQGNTSYFLDDIKVKVGSKLYLALPEVDIEPEIIKIVE